MPRPTAGSVLATPHLIVVLLLVANIVAYLLCLRVGGTVAIPTWLLAAAGALTPAALQPGEQWRLVAAGFLHADPTHLLVNLLSLLITGPFLERRLGATLFTLVYAASLVGAGLVSVAMHPGPFLGVGASGAVFGVMGALFALWALGAEDLSPSFFLVNFAINASLASRDPRIDWAAHIGGFVTGMAMVALLDMMSRANSHWLRCKFPEFVKAGASVLLVAGGVALWHGPPLDRLGPDPRVVAAGCMAVAALGIVKLLDLLLSVRRGLAAVVLVLMAGNAAMGWAICRLVLPALGRTCAAVGAFGTFDGGAAYMLCPNLTVLPLVTAGLVAALTLLALSGPLRRGLGDVGFVAATFMGDRRRDHGLVRPARHTRT